MANITIKGEKLRPLPLRPEQDKEQAYSEHTTTATQTLSRTEARMGIQAGKREVKLLLFTTV